MSKQRRLREAPAVRLPPSDPTLLAGEDDPRWWFFLIGGICGFFVGAVFVVLAP